MTTLPNRPKDNPWKLKTPPGTSDYTMHTDQKDGKQIRVCTVDSTVLHDDAWCINDLHAMLKRAGDWVELGGADEQKPAKERTVEAWGAFRHESDWRLVRLEEGPARPLWCLCASAHGGVWAM